MVVLLTRSMLFYMLRLDFAGLTLKASTLFRSRKIISFWFTGNFCYGVLFNWNLLSVDCELWMLSPVGYVSNYMLGCRPFRWMAYLAGEVLFTMLDESAIDGNCCGLVLVRKRYCDNSCWSGLMGLISGGIKTLDLVFEDLPFSFPFSISTFCATSSIFWIVRLL